MPEYYRPFSLTSTSAMVLSQDEMKTNATFIYGYMKNRYGWTVEAVAGMLGNVEAESTMNPSRPQNNAINNKWWDSAPGRAGGAVTPTTVHYGFGLFQITPWGNWLKTSTRYNPYTLGNWSLDNGYTVDRITSGTIGTMECQLDWLMSGAPEHSYTNTADPSHDQKKWFQHRASPTKNCGTPALYGKQTDTPENMAITFYWNFERSGAGNPGNRPKLARKWHDFLGGITPPVPLPETKILKGGKNVWRILHLIQQ